MKLILVVTLMFCLLAINAERHGSRRRPFYWMHWRRTTMCIKTAAGYLSKCPGVRANFQHNWGHGRKRALENEEEDNDKPENDDVVSTREIYDAVDKAGNSGVSTRNNRLPSK